MTTSDSSPSETAEDKAMTIFYHGQNVRLTEREVFDFSVTLGIAVRAPEAKADKLASVERAREVWTKLGVWTIPGYPNLKPSRIPPEEQQ